ncbi:hypothetical protein [Streptomyces triticirhizae]|uniref:DUF4190 domain-containing protein n=1 Tax=Streptomyces triticirhizae TaxID=2483353 RepID=A0A3M2LIV2_9ACTN|nr:hypothetical protein [Streptomyces triticirhizae]RMI37407.1 hypothetical protein EBN88_19175 [Streptomyces triticirhizae]
MSTPTTPGWPAGGPEPPAPPAPPPPARFEPLAVWAFVLSLVALFPVALVLGVLALGRLATGRGRGRGLAIAAMALAGAQIVALAVLVPLALNASDDGPGGTAESGEREPDDGGNGDKGSDDGANGDDAEGPDGEERTVLDIGIGDCFDSSGGIDQYEDEGARERFVTVLPCEAPHEGEVFGSVEVTGYDSFPGVEELAAFAERECPRLAPSFVLDMWALPAEVVPYYYHPEPGGWGLGDREILCFFAHVEGDALDASLRGDPGAFDEESLAYLELTNPLEITVWYEPLPGESDLATGREWAAEMVSAIEDEMESLSGAEWPRVAEPVDRLLVARQESLPVWESAASASDEDAFWSAVEEGYATMGIDIEVEIRETLGLASG